MLSQQDSNPALTQLLSPGSKRVADIEFDPESAKQLEELKLKPVKNLKQASHNAILPVALLVAAFLCLIAEAILLISNDQNAVKQKIELMLPALGAVLFAAGIKPLICHKKSITDHAKLQEPVMVWPRGLKPMPLPEIDTRSEQEIFESIQARLKAHDTASAPSIG